MEQELKVQECTTTESIQCGFKQEWISGSNEDKSISFEPIWKTLFNALLPALSLNNVGAENMGQAKLRGTFEQRKVESETDQKERLRLQRWLKSRQPSPKRKRLNVGLVIAAVVAGYAVSIDKYNNVTRFKS